MYLRKIALTFGALVLLLPNLTSAASFSDGEVKQIQHWQQSYARLDKTSYNRKNLYQTRPRLSRRFSAGKVKGQYLKTQLAYINFYRSLFGLDPISDSKIANENAQKTAAIMAAINADPFVNQHGLPTDIKPHYISSSLWHLAQDTSETSNLNFNVANQSAGAVISDLLTDHYNLSGSDTGHRAWILSTRLSSTGFGAAYGTNGYRYSVQKVLNLNDLFKVPSKETVAYPCAGLFPIELIHGKNIAWSLYLSNKVYNHTPQVEIRDLDTNKTYKAVHVHNYSKDGFGNFKTVITYCAGKTPLIAGHEYQVDIAGIYKYNFKLFKLNTNSSSDKLNSNSAHQNGSVTQDTNFKTAIARTSAKTWARTNHNKSQTKNKKADFEKLKKGLN